MNEVDALDLVREAFWTVIVAASPAVGAAMVIGLAIALFQALTQVQEMTLTFIPKILVIFLMLIASGTFIGTQITSFTQIVYDHIESGF
ncbi:flagellar biosynthetic protein FliQ [Cohaesibacter marisflavi]|uniref:Flagellar biosynthetic protein FliQ n=1 Tax=Cohaesibacter marisflavi TaxID=655353 RepID=A0A1I5C8R9_9HYPH|nr:flagellar biosynthesis protein FliQ [Cohaesibacter marisflavi]SFN83425.1 flagellar biosynthetic protein FliQ [Cohaesibacter marisflavi]